MPIDYSLLQQQPVGRVVGTLPVMPNSMNQFGQGLMQGLSQGAQINEANTHTAMMQQQMQEQKQLFPSQLAKSQADASSAQSDATVKGIQAKSAVQQWNDLQTQRAAFAKSFNDGMNALMKTDPKAALDMQNTQAQIRNTLSQAAEHMANAQSQVLENYNKMSATGAQAAMAALRAPAGQEQQVWQQQLNLMEPSIAKMFPQTVTRGNLMGLVSNGIEASSQLQQQKIMANATPEEKDAIRLGQLNQTATFRPLTVAEQTEKDALTKAQENKYINKEIDKQDASQLGQVVDRQTTSMKLLRDTEDLWQIAKQLPPGYTGPIVDYFKANKMNSQVQEIQKLQADIPLLYRNAVGMDKGVGRFTNAILDQLKTATGTTALNMEALQWVASRVHDVAVDDIKEAYKTEFNIRQRGMSSDKFQMWQKQNPEPQLSYLAGGTYNGGARNQGNVPQAGANAQPSPAQMQVPQGRVKVQSPDGKVGHIPANQLQDALKEGYKQVQ